VRFGNIFSGATFNRLYTSSGKVW